MACSCVLVLNYLRSIGAEHAAKMHQYPTIPWTANDWRLHIFEERKYLWPKIREHGTFTLLSSKGVRELVSGDKLVAQLEADHLDFEAELRDNGYITSPYLPLHSALEDELVRQMVG